MCKTRTFFVLFSLSLTWLLFFKTCKYPFIGTYCESTSQYLIEQLKNAKTNQLDFNNDPRFHQVVDICRLYKEAKIELCKNGGYCVSLFAGKGI